MDLTSPIRSVIPAVQGDVLAVLARTDAPLSGRRVASIIGDRVSTKGVSLALGSLVEAGLVIVEPAPPAKLYRLNRRHMAAEAIGALAELRGRMIEAMRGHLDGWDLAPWGAWLYGSAARGDGTTRSDVDVMVVRPTSVSADDERWAAQIERLADDVAAWTGNRCEIAELGVSELCALVDAGGRLADGLRADGIALTRRRLPNRRATARATG